MSQLSAAKLKALAKEFTKDKIISDGRILKCNLCDLVIKVDDKHQKSQLIALSHIQI